MNKKAGYILRFLLGGYLIFLGVQIFIQMAESKPTNMVYINIMGIILAAAGILYVSVNLKKLYTEWRAANPERAGKEKIKKRREKKKEKKKKNIILATIRSKRAASGLSDGTEADGDTEPLPVSEIQRLYGKTAEPERTASAQPLKTSDREKVNAGQVRSPEAGSVPAGSEPAGPEPSAVQMKPAEEPERPEPAESGKAESAPKPSESEPAEPEPSAVQDESEQQPETAAQTAAASVTDPGRQAEPEIPAETEEKENGSSPQNKRKRTDIGDIIMIGEEADPSPEADRETAEDEIENDYEEI